MSDLPIVQKTYDLIKWYVPILNRLPRDHRFTLGERMISGLYDLLEMGIYRVHFKGVQTYSSDVGDSIRI